MTTWHPGISPLPGGLGWQRVQDLSIDVWVQVHASGKTVTAVVPCLPRESMAG